MMSKRVLVVGFIPEVVDLSAFPGMTVEKVHAGLKAQMEEFTARGIEAVSCLVDLGETADQVTRAALVDAAPFDVVVIGAGIRQHPAHFQLFERLLNVVHAHAPTAKIAFNTLPTDTVDAALRWLEKPIVSPIG
jgi:hypothetical protein